MQRKCAGWIQKVNGKREKRNEIIRLKIFHGKDKNKKKESSENSTKKSSEKLQTGKS